jgi:hypothetical protein
VPSSGRLVQTAIGDKLIVSPGVIPFRDLRSGTWNFPPDFMKIPTPEEFAFDRTPQYVPPSQDEVCLPNHSVAFRSSWIKADEQELTSLAKREECKFIGSTSTLTGAFSQIYFAISGGKGVDLSNFSQSFASEVRPLSHPMPGEEELINRDQASRSGQNYRRCSSSVHWVMGATTLIAISNTIRKISSADM